MDRTRPREIRNWRPSIRTIRQLRARLFRTSLCSLFRALAAKIPLAGFNLTDLLLHTLEGGLDPNDPDNIRFLNAPVLVADITLYDPVADEELTLDGIFGMNFLLASATLDFDQVNESPFNWIVFDEPNGMLGLDLKAVPEPTTFILAAIGLVAVAGQAWRRRRAVPR